MATTTKKKKSTMLALPAKAKQDAKTVAGILDKWTEGVEDIIKETLSWVKKHKILVLLGLGVYLFFRWGFGDEQPKEQYDDEDY